MSRGGWAECQLLGPVQATFAVVCPVKFHLRTFVVGQQLV